MFITFNQEFCTTFCSFSLCSFKIPYRFYRLALFTCAFVCLLYNPFILAKSVFTLLYNLPLPEFVHLNEVMIVICRNFFMQIKLLYQSINEKWNQIPIL